MSIFYKLTIIFCILILYIISEGAKCCRDADSNKITRLRNLNKSFLRIKDSVRKLDRKLNRSENSLHTNANDTCMQVNDKSAYKYVDEEIIFESE